MYVGFSFEVFLMQYYFSAHRYLISTTTKILDFKIKIFVVFSISLLSIFRQFTIEIQIDFSMLIYCHKITVVSIIFIDFLRSFITIWTKIDMRQCHGIGSVLLKSSPFGVVWLKKFLCAYFFRCWPYVWKYFFNILHMLKHNN